VCEKATRRGTPPKSGTWRSFSILFSKKRAEEHSEKPFRKGPEPQRSEGRRGLIGKKEVSGGGGRGVHPSKKFEKGGGHQLPGGTRTGPAFLKKGVRRG